MDYIVFICGTGKTTKKIQTQTMYLFTTSTEQSSQQF
jgi:hypothetical protein